MIKTKDGFLNFKGRLCKWKYVSGVILDYIPSCYQETIDEIENCLKSIAYENIIFPYDFYNNLQYEEKNIIEKQVKDCSIVELLFIVDKRSEVIKNDNKKRRVI